MGGGKGATAEDPQLEAAQVSNSNALTGLLTQQGANSNQLFQESFPGFQTAESASQVLASGDPAAIARLISPATQQIASATAGAKQNILNTAPAGGEKNLAIENADVNQGAQVGALATQGFNNSFNSLAQLAGQGINQGVSSAGTAISAGSAANQGYGNVVQENIQQKGATLGAISGLGSTAMSGLAYGLTKAFA